MNGSGMPVIGMMPIVIPMFSKTWNTNIARTPMQHERAEEVVGAGGAARQMRQTISANSAEQRGATDEAELLPHHGEDEVGVLLGHVARRSSGCP